MVEPNYWCQRLGLRLWVFAFTNRWVPSDPPSDPACWLPKSEFPEEPAFRALQGWLLIRAHRPWNVAYAKIKKYPNVSWTRKVSIPWVRRDHWWGAKEEARVGQRCWKVRRPWLSCQWPKGYGSMPDTRSAPFWWKQIWSHRKAPQKDSWDRQN